jgi:hypothetical protein
LAHAGASPHGSSALRERRASAALICCSGRVRRRADKLVQLIARQKGLSLAAIDAQVALVGGFPLDSSREANGWVLTGSQGLGPSLVERLRRCR